MNDGGYRIELFVFPDGDSVEIIVFGREACRRGAAAPAAPTSTAAPAPAGSTASAASQASAAAPAPCCVPAPPSREDVDAQTCPACGSTLVHPVDWQRSGDAAWTLILRCPECETRREVVLGRASVEQLNRELYHGTQVIAHEAERLTRRNFEDEVEWLVAALERDLIQPMDF